MGLCHCGKRDFQGASPSVPPPSELQHILNPSPVPHIQSPNIMPVFCPHVFKNMWWLPLKTNCSAAFYCSLSWTVAYIAHSFLRNILLGEKLWSLFKPYCSLMKMKGENTQIWPYYYFKNLQVKELTQHDCTEILRFVGKCVCVRMWRHQQELRQNWGDVHLGKIRHGCIFNFPQALTIEDEISTLNTLLKKHSSWCRHFASPNGWARCFLGCLKELSCGLHKAAIWIWEWQISALSR